MPLPPTFVVLPNSNNSRAPLRRHAGAGVADVDDQFLTVLVRADMNLAALRLRFHGIAQEIIEGLAQPRRVALNLPGSGGEIFGKG